MPAMFSAIPMASPPTIAPGSDPKPPTTPAANPFREIMVAMEEFTLNTGITEIPSAPQIAKLMATVTAIFRDTSIPISAAAVLLEATQRIALPVFVFRINNSKSPTMTMEITIM